MKFASQIFGPYVGLVSICLILNKIYFNFMTPELS